MDVGGGHACGPHTGAGGVQQPFRPAEERVAFEAPLPDDLLSVLQEITPADKRSAVLAEPSHVPAAAPERDPDPGDEPDDESEPDDDRA